MRRHLLRVLIAAWSIPVCAARAQTGVNRSPFMTDVDQLDPDLQEVLTVAVDPDMDLPTKQTHVHALSSGIEIIDRQDGNRAVAVLIRALPLVSPSSLEALISGVTIDSVEPIIDSDAWFYTAVVEVPLSPFTSLASQPLYQLANAAGFVERLSASRRLQPDLDVSTASAQGGPGGNLQLGMGARTLQTRGFKGTGAKIGVIDGSIDYYHGDFLKDDGTPRVQRIWDQTLTAIGNEKPPNGFAFGVEYDHKTITIDFIAGTLIPSFRHSVVRSADTGGHGTAVAGVAAGDGSSSPNNPGLFAGVAPAADLYIVKAGTWKQVVSGLQYLFGQAGTAPMVVNLSLGTQLGSHDGAHDWSVSLAKQTRAGKILVASAGNGADKMVHAEDNVHPLANGGGARTTTFDVASGADEVQVNIYTHQNNVVSIEAEAPFGNIKSRVRPPNVADNNATDEGSYTGVWKVDNQIAPVFVNVSISNNTPNIGKAKTDRLMTVKLTAPSGDTGRCDGGNKDGKDCLVPADCPGGSCLAWSIPTGTWTLRLHPLNITGDGLYDAWLETQPTSNLASFLQNHTANETVNDIGCHDDVIAVASHVTKGAAAAVGSIAPSAGAGATRNPTDQGAGRQKPDLCAPGEMIETVRSADAPPPAVPGADAFHAKFGGTSFAAPHVTGAIALMLRRNPTLTPAFALQVFDTYFTVADAATGTLPNLICGRGKLFMAHDSDGDGLTDFEEDANLNLQKDDGETDPFDPDTDEDAFLDGADNCPLISNPAQVDTDADERGDGCDPCTNVGGGQNMTGSRKVILRGLNSPAGDDKLVAKGELNLPAGESFATLNPVADGARVLLQSQTGTTLADVILPAGAWGGAGTAGWRSTGAPVRKWTFLDQTPAPAQGIQRMLVKLKSSAPAERVQIRVTGKTGSYPATSTEVPLIATLVLGASQSAADAGLCGEALFSTADCAVKAAGDKVICRAR